MQRPKSLTFFLLCFLTVTACIQTSSEPPIVATQIVPDPSPTIPATTAPTLLPATTIPTTQPNTASVETPPPETIDIEGTVRLALSNAIIDQPLRITAIYVIGFPDNATVAYEKNTTSDAVGSFTLNAIPFDFGILTLTTLFDGVVQSYPIPISTNMLDGNTIDVDFPVYRAGQKSDVILQTLEITAEPSPENERLFMTQVVEIRNNGNGIVVPSSEGSFAIPLPSNVQNPQLLIPPALNLQPAVLAEVMNSLSDENAELNIIAFDNRDEPTFLGQIALLPGEEHVIFFALTYELPYLGNTLVEQKLAHNVETASIFIPSGQTITLRSDQFSGIASLQRNDNALEGYTNITTLSAGDTLRFTLSQPSIVFLDNVPDNQIETSTNEDIVSMLTLVSGLLLLVIGGGYIFYDLQRRGIERHDQEQKNRTEQVTALLDAIVELDEQFADGQINIEEYETKRKSLKLKLSQYVETNNSNEHVF